MFYPRAYLVRLSMTIASLYLVLAVALLASYDAPFGVGFDGLAVLFGAGWFLLVWMRTVSWTRWRVAVALFMFVTFLGYLEWWLPHLQLCWTYDIAASAGLLLLAFWVWVCARIWRIGAGFAARDHGLGKRSATGGQNMERIAVSCASAVALAPLVYGVLFLADAFFSTRRSLPWRYEPVFAVAVTALVLAVGWVIAWSPCVSWKPRLAWLTGGLCLCFVVLATLAWLAGPVWDWINEEVAVSLVFVAAGAYLIFTVHIWSKRPTPGVAGEFAPLCPDCGYNMTGLERARCPECGRAYTLDKLLAANLNLG